MVARPSLARPSAATASSTLGIAPRPRAGRRAVLLLAAPLLALLAACAGGSATEPAIEVHRSPTPAATAPPATPHVTTATPEPTPETQPAADPRPARCREGEAALAARLAALDAAIREAMEGYVGEWSVALIDLDCGGELEVHADWVQYTASAGKIVPIIAALRAVEAGELEFERMEGHLLQVMRHSLDHDATLINQMVTPEQVAEVLTLAGVSERTRFPHLWNRAEMPAIDLARVWAALLEGRLLSEERTEYLLDLAAGAEIPQGLETFPAQSGIEGYQLGQKAGYYVSDGIPYFLLGAGYLRPAPPAIDREAEEPMEGAPGAVAAAEDAAPQHLGVAMVFMMRTTNPQLGDPQRREVFPLLASYVTNSDGIAEASHASQPHTQQHPAHQSRTHAGESHRAPAP